MAFTHGKEHLQVIFKAGGRSDNCNMDDGFNDTAHPPTSEQSCICVVVMHFSQSYPMPSAIS